MLGRLGAAWLRASTLFLGLPFEVKVPNAKTRKAMAELESGKGKKFIAVDDLMADLNADE